MTRYFAVYGSRDDSLGVAYVERPDDDEVYSRRSGQIVQWSPVNLILRDGELCDYPATDLGAMVCSGKMRKILENYVAPSDNLQWLDVRIVAAERVDSFYILHFPEEPDVLDLERSVFDEFGVVRPVISNRKAELHGVFVREKGDKGFVVSDRAKKGMEDAGLRGLVFERVASE